MAFRALIFGLLFSSLSVTVVQAAPTARQAEVSSSGVDKAGCGSGENPCRTLQYAHDDIVAAGGEILIKDSGEYGAIAIRKSIRILNEGAGVATIAKGGGSNAIVVNAGPTDFVEIRGITLDGLDNGNIGIEGLVFGTLIVRNVVARRFSAGIFLQTSNNLTFEIYDSQLTDNRYEGLYVNAQNNVQNLSKTRIYGILENDQFNNNGGNGGTGDGAYVISSLFGLDLTVTNCQFSFNATYGLYIGAAVAGILNGNTALNNSSGQDLIVDAEGIAVSFGNNAIYSYIIHGQFSTIKLQ